MSHDQAEQLLDTLERIEGLLRRLVDSGSNQMRVVPSEVNVRELTDHMTEQMSIALVAALRSQNTLEQK